MGSFLVHADVSTIEAIDGYVTARAKQLAETLPDDPHLQTDDERRVYAFLLMVAGKPDGTEPADLLPQVCLYAHTYADTDQPGPGADSARTRPSTPTLRSRSSGSRAMVR